MPEAFDPYSAWLSIPVGARPPDYYQLLALAPLESDLFRIVTSTDRQISHVLPFLAGERAAEARLLLEELLTAKGFLITPTAKAIYDAEFRQRLAASGSPEDAALLDLLANSPPAEPDPPRATPPAATPPTAAPPAYEAEAPPVVVPPSTPPVAVEGVARATLLAPPGATFGSAAPASGAANVTMATAAHPIACDAANGEPPPETAQIPDSAEGLDSPRYDPRRLARDYDRRSSWAAPAIAFLVALTAVGLAAGVAWQRGYRLRIAAADAPQTTARDNTSFRSPSTGQPSTARPATVQPTTVPPVTVPPTPESPPSSSSALPERAQPSSSASDDPSLPANPKSPNAEPTYHGPNMPAPSDARQIAKLQASLGLAREALAARDLAAADKQLEAASAQASSPELIARVAAVRTLRDYVDGFWKAVRDSAKTLRGGEEFTVRGKVVVIVEARQDEIVLRAAGENRTYKLHDLPPYMATALAERWLAKDEVNSKVFVGAFWLVDPKVDRELAREKLAEAAAAGAPDAATLARLLVTGTK